MNSNGSNSLNNNGNSNFNRNGSMNNIHNVEKTMQKFQQLAKDAQSNGDLVQVENFLQHADHYARRLNELNLRTKPVPGSNGQTLEKKEEENKVKVKEPINNVEENNILKEEKA